MQPTLCLLIGGKKEEKEAYTRLLDKTTDAKITNQLDIQNILKGFDNEKYIVVDAEQGTENSLIRLAGFYGAEVVGIFFEHSSISKKDFTRTVFREDLICDGIQ